MSKPETNKDKDAKKAFGKGRNSKNRNFKGGKNSVNKRNSSRGGSTDEYRSKGSCERNPDTGSYATPNNDPAWYKYNDIIFEDATKVSYFNQVGIPYYPPQHVKIPTTDVYVDYEGAVLPSVMSIEWTPTFGTTEAGAFGTVAANAAINIQAKAMFTALQSKVSSKITAFTASDIAVYLIAIDSILSFYAHCQRLIGLWRHYDVMNTAMPDAFIRAYSLGGASSMQTAVDMPRFISDLNTFGVNIQRLLIPKDLPIFTRHQWLNSNVYMDDTTVKSSYFMYVPTYLWKFSDGHAEGDIGSCANMVQVPSFTSTGLQGMIEFLTSLAEPLLNDQDTFQIISMLIRAMDPNDFYRLSLTPTDYVVNPVYNAEVLLQLHNADVVGRFNLTNPDYKPQITQLPTENITYSLFCPSAVGGHLRGDKMIDMPIDAVTPELTMVATRFKVTADPYQATDSSPRYQRLISFGSEVINVIRVIYGYSYGWGGNQLNDFTLYNNAIPCMDGGSGTPIHQFPILEYGSVRHFAMYYKFHYAPMIYLTTDIKGGTYNEGPWNPQSAPLDVFGDLTNYTTISPEALERMHRAALLGEWYIPSLVSYYPAK